MWAIKGLKRGIITSSFPREEDSEIKPSLYSKSARDVFTCLNYGPVFEEREDAIEIREKMKFKKSVHIFVLDVGSCGACNREISLLSAPQYDFHRLGFFFTPVPRHADVLLIIGEGTDKMKKVVEEAYESMPEPRYVMVAGACAGEFTVVPVHARVSGCPPQPISILKALLMATGRWDE